MAQIPYGIYVREYIRKIPLHVSMLRRANRVFAVSRDVGSYLADVVPAERMRVCHDAIDAGAVVRRAAAVGMATPGLLPFDEHPLVGYVGRLTSYKQPELFLRAAARIARAKPSTRFLVVGGEGPNETGYSDRLMRLAGELGICDALSFLGHRRDALHIIRRLAVLCVTSDREPFPRTILEAQVLGVPVVAPSTGGCPEMIRHGVNGLLFGAPNEHADQRLAEAVSSLLDDTDLAKRIGHRAAADVRVSFGGDGPVRYFEHCLEELVGIVGPSRKSVPV
jgi:glycosyltransferase involved in cell wall biosynthesis